MADEGSSNVVDTTKDAPWTSEGAASTVQDSPEQAPAQQPETGDNGKKALKVPDSLKPKPNDQERFRGRISELVNSRKALEGEVQNLRSQLAVLQGGKQEQPAGRQAQGDAPPNPDDFDKYQDYVDALVDYKVNLREKVNQQKQTEEGYRIYQQEKRAEFEQHAQAIVEQVPEFWEAVTDPSLPVTDAMAEAVMELGQMAPFTMLWLASNRQEALRIARMPPRAATVAIGKLAVQLEKTLGDDAGSQPTQAEPAKPQFTPKPVPQIRGSAPGNLNDGPTDKDDARTWMIKEAERQRKKFGNPNLKVYIPR